MHTLLGDSSIRHMLAICDRVPNCSLVQHGFAIRCAVTALLLSTPADCGRQALEPLLQRAGVDLLFAGHIHA